MKQLIRNISSLSLLFASQMAFSQFAPPVGQAGTTAMYKDSSAFIDWAHAGVVNRGYQDISNTSLGYANVGDETMALGVAGANGVVSLGDGGSIILQFNSPLADGPGPDLAVFENSFNDTFLELAFVEASSDGINFFRFPATSNTDTTTQTSSFGPTDATKINNLAGKYKALYGTPFDLADLPTTGLLNPLAITHIKVIDVVGCIQNVYCSRDKNNHKVNDPWPTDFGSGGFDLDAVGIIHNQTNVGIEELELTKSHLFPNPAKDEVYITNASNQNYSVQIHSGIGTEVFHLNNQSGYISIDISELADGVYFITISKETQKEVLKFIKVSSL
jgi:hypothetical protein